MEAPEQRARDIVEQIRPYVQSEGGDVAVDRFQDGILYIRLSGGGTGSVTSLLMLKMGIERRLCDEVQGITSVEIA